MKKAAIIIALTALFALGCGEKKDQRAAENLLLAANALGLGAVWCGIYPQAKKVSYMTEFLELPEEIIPMCLISIGYPAEAPQPKDKWHPEYIHYENF